MNSDETSRTALLLGDDAVEKLRNSFVVVAGAGGVGGYAIEALVRAGVGKIRVIDDHIIDSSNLNRQILATKETIGKKKSDVAKERALSINPDVDFEAVHELISAKTINKIMEGNPDVIVDAIDTVANKIFLLRYAAEHDIRTFSSMGSSLRTDPWKIRKNTLKRTRMCPLACACRSGLKDLKTTMITCIYSEEPVSVKPSEKDDHMKSRLGSLPTMPAIFGMTVANEAILYLISDECRNSKT